MKKRVYVVDDQISVLKTAVFILQALGDDWEIQEFLDPAQALAAAKTTPPDVVLSDFLMPGMSGSELLSQIRDIVPNSIRIIMSGHVPLEKLSTITSAHQYLAKPFDALKLKDVIQRSLAAQERFQNSQLQSLITSLHSLPSLPHVYHALLAELEDSRGAGSVIAKMLSEDPGLSTKVLHMANSPLFGPGYLISDPLDGVLCLGTDMIKAIVLSQALFKQYTDLRHPEVDLKRLWNHCWDVAQLGQHFCREKQLGSSQAQEAFLAGIVHEMGRLVLIDNFPAQYSKACQKAHSTASPLMAHLTEAFGAAPSQVTAYLLQLWGMPNAVVEAISLQGHPEQDRAERFSLAGALYVANQIASIKAPPDSFAAPEWDQNYLQKLGCAEDLPAWQNIKLSS